MAYSNIDIEGNDERWEQVQDQREKRGGVSKNMKPSMLAIWPTRLFMPNGVLKRRTLDTAGDRLGTKRPWTSDTYDEANRGNR